MNINHEIEKVAYELYVKDGYIPGREIDHWLKAEQIVHSRYAVSFEDKPAKPKKASTTKTAAKKVASKGSKTPARR
jgi:Protein of unknown function (DUF2934)